MKDHKVKAFYEGDAEDYNQRFYEAEEAYPPLRYRHNYILDMVGELGLHAEAKILDIGCGPGEMVIDLMQQNWALWGIDIAENMVKIAERKLAAAREKNSEKANFTHISVGDIENLDFEDGFFDVVIASGVVEYLKDDEEWSRELSRVLKPGGHLILNVTNKKAIRLWTAPVIQSLKRSKPVHSSMNFFKEKILRRGKLNAFPFRPRLHVPRKFDAFLQEKGFEKVSHRYFDFGFLPAPLGTVFGFVTIPIRKRMERNSHKDKWLTGTGYIVCARKVAKP